MRPSFPLAAAVRGLFAAAPVGLALAPLLVGCPKETRVNSPLPEPATFVAEPPAPFVGELQVHTFRYENGLTLKVIPDHTAPVVAWQTWMGVGSRDEIASKTGLAHFFEHMMFKGTDGYPDGDFDRLTDEMGAEGLNAWTWLDQTVYVEAVPKAALPELVRLEAIRFDGLVVEQEPFDSEREVVINERRLRVDNDPDGRMSEVLFSKAFEQHTYGWPTIGWMADLEALTVDDARSFYKRWYTPDNATIIVSGDVTPEEVAGLVREHYGRMPSSGATRAEPPVEPEQTAQRREVLVMPMSSERISVGFKVPAYTHADIPALMVLDAALTAGRSGRLQRALKDAGYASSVGAFIMPLKHPSLYEVDIQLRPGVSAEAAEAVLFRELAAVAAEGLSEGELAMGRAALQASQWAQLEDAAGKADFLGWATVHTGDHADGLARLEALGKVTQADIQRVTATWLQASRSTVVIGRPDEPPPAVEVNPRPFTPAPRILVEARPLGGGSDLPRGEVTEREVAGAKVLAMNDATLPLVDFKLRFPRGAGAEAKSGVANLAGRLLLRGTTRRDRASFEAALEQLGASASVGVSADAVTLSGTCLAESWPAFISLLGEALTSPAYSEAELAQIVEEIQSDLESRRDDDGALASLAWQRAVWGADHPYGRDSRGTAEAIAKVTVEDLRAFHQTFLRSGGAVVALGGALDSGALEDVSGLLTALEGQPGPVPAWPAPPALQGRKLVIVDKPERSQAQVRVGHRGLDPRSESWPAFLLTNDGFGVGFGGRLMKEVRVARGWSYFAYSRPVPFATDSGWTIGLAPGSEYAVDAVKLVLDLAATADSSGLTPEEFNRARSARVQGRPFLVDTASERLDHAFQRAALGYDSVSQTDAMVNVSLEDANRAFAAAIDPENVAVIVVATAADVREGLEAAFGPAEVIPHTAL